MVRKYNLKYYSDINHGYCFIWAYLVWALWTHGGVTFKTTTGHVIVHYNGHYYDCDHFDGRPDTREFMCFGYSTIKHLDINWMTWYWARCGKKMREFRRLLRKCNPQLYKFARANGMNEWDNPHENFASYTEIDRIPEVTELMA